MSKLTEIIMGEVLARRGTSNLKPYGWGIVDDEGLHVDYATNEESAVFQADLHNAICPNRGPYRVVQLFYKEGE